MEGKRDEEKELQGGPRENWDPDGRILWDNDLDEEIVPLLEGSMRQTIKDWIPVDLPGPWDKTYKNPFLFDK